MGDCKSWFCHREHERKDLLIKKLRAEIKRLREKCSHEQISVEPGDGSIQCQQCGKILNGDPNWP